MKLEINGKKKKGGGILAGLILFVIGVVALWWNEGRTVKTAGSISEFEKSYVVIDSTKVDNANDGKPIYVHGNLVYDTNGSIDDEFNITVDSAVLNRTVEMYQWKEECTTDSDDNESCSYSKVWSDDIIESKDFYESGHTNPTTMPYNSIKSYANYIKVDEYDIMQFSGYLSTTKEYTELSSEVAQSHDLNILDGYYTTVGEDSNAQIGDIRIKFTYNDAKELSIIGKQSGDKIVEYESSNGYTVHNLREANVSASDLIQELRDENNLIKWIIRIGGTIFVMCGLMAIISPIQRLASYVPVLGKIFNAATNLIMCLLGLCISLIVIAVAWLRFRPVLSVILIAIVIGFIILIRKLKKKKKEENQTNLTDQNTVVNQADNQMNTVNQNTAVTQTDNQTNTIDQNTVINQADNQMNTVNQNTAVTQTDNQTNTIDQNNNNQTL